MSGSTETKEKDWIEFDIKEPHNQEDVFKGDVSNISEGMIYYFPTTNEIDEEHVQQSDLMLSGKLKLSNSHPEVETILPPDWENNLTGSQNWLFILHSLRWLEIPLNAYRYTKNEKYLTFINSVIESWIEGNNPRKETSEMAWRDHPTSYRLRFFVYYRSVYTKIENFDESFDRKLLLSIYQHMLYHNDQDNFHMKSNHSLEMIGAILSASHHYKNVFKRADEFFSLSVKLLTEYLNLNFSEKGYHFEQSPGYHWYVLKRLILINDYLDHYNISVGTIVDLIPKILRANRMLMKPDFTFQTIGDTQKIDMKNQLRFEPKETSFILTDFEVCEESGYAIFRDDQSLTVFRCNNFIGSHGHSDFLSFTHYSHETDWFIDSGYYTYNKDEHREYFTSSFAHNTVIINGKSGKPNDKKTELVFNNHNDYVKAGRYLDSGTHERSFQKVAESDYIINDIIRLNERGKVEQLFHIHPSISIKSISKNVIELENQDGVTCYVTQLNTIGTWEVIKGQEEPYIQGWYSEKFNKKVPTFTLKYVANDKESYLLKTFIHFSSCPLMDETV
ncbi:hypothetical protein CR194_13090 [Salipaludibacillus keqinensis]|uniref:Uncharacterized protein n=1 Tax=Salipaludibacillus keqinensis TaxID=2045207 RepID=A0A323TCR6_9BACI|nr:alginate lyase family protein [Salipaludibacillus keqinensis]PYZ92600.1 hypothetical protein CR194_13090 [Salipaludibacillus keqinensis]